MLKFFLASLIVGSGVIIGAILSVIAKDELKPGKKYFLLLKNILFSVIILITSIFYITINPLISFFILIFFSILFIKRFQLNLIYVAFAAVYILSSINEQLFILTSSLIFFAGFSIGTVATHELIKKEIFVERNILIPYFIFIFISLIRYLISFL